MLFGEIAILTAGAVPDVLAVLDALWVPGVLDMLCVPGVLWVSDALDVLGLLGVLMPSPLPQLLSTPIVREAVKNLRRLRICPPRCH
jgi:hypothetical protein